MISRIAKIMERIQEIRTRFHLDSANPLQDLSGKTFAQNLARESERVAASGNVFKPYQSKPAAADIARMPLPLPGLPNFGSLPPPMPAPKVAPAPLTVETAPQPKVETAPLRSFQPPPLPALPFDTGLEPYLPSMTPRLPGTPGLPVIPQAGQSALPPALPGGAGLDALSTLLPQGGAGLNDLSGLQSLLDIYRRAGSWEQALGAYNSVPGPGLRSQSGLPFP